VTQRDEVVHIASHDGPATVAALMDLARAQVTVKKVSVQSTTLDDVFCITPEAICATRRKGARAL
jgi:hypothetical protein